ncbi:MAG: polymer-forming cytoskeletal protein [Candidatus Omnitrophica bacterium]|nr:polymer-forming cytoskeletal protein [Candidatus Omnitrophota bacterium]HOX54168.1 polymer-forming cytoskeletal protein [Candidatus Omnitrophota bacterium]
MAFKDKKTDDKILDVDASMQGTLSFKDPVNLRINGHFDGTLETKGNLTIGEAASVTAHIVGENIIIAGKVKGDVTAMTRLVFLPTAVFHGDIKTPKLNIVEGAVFQGKCNMIQDLLDADEVSRFLEIDKNSLLDWANSGKIPAVKEGNSWRFERNKIEEWVASGKIR